jgi:histidine triad (HIT) family protein
MDECLFCRIIEGAVPATRVYEDEEILAFEDVNPQAPTHVLIIPKLHLATALDIEAGHSELIGRAFIVAKQIARERGVADEGYRVVLNCNRGAGQTVFHVHFHLLAGRPLGWPPG